MNVTTGFTEELVSLAKSYSDDAEDAAAPQGGGSYATYAVISLHGLRIFLDETYETTIDRLEVMPPILGIIGLEAADLPHPSTLCKWFDRIMTDVWWCCCATWRSCTTHPITSPLTPPIMTALAPASTTVSGRTAAYRRSKPPNSSIRSYKRSSTSLHNHQTRQRRRVCAKLAHRYTGELRVLSADKGYDGTWLRNTLREHGIRPLIKHRVHAPYDHAHNARISDELYAQRSMTETVNSAVKRSLGVAVRARE